jgi:hypothetical protein
MRQTAQHSHGSGFAGSIWPEKTEDGAHLDCQREILHGMDVTVAFTQVMKCNNRLIHLNLIAVMI